MATCDSGILFFRLLFDSLTWGKGFVTVTRMNRWSIRWLLVLAVLVAFTYESPAPLIYKPGEGWYYEPVGAKGDWMKGRAKDQLDVAKEAFGKKDYKLALRAARRTVVLWPLSDYAPEAQYTIGRCYEARGNSEKAFKEYQKLLEKFPKYSNYEEVVRRQFEIANLYLAGKWFRVLGILPLYRSMDKTADMYEKVIKNGPYTEVAPLAQMKIGAAQENKRGLFGKAPDYYLAAKAYNLAADRYYDRTQIASDASFKEGQSYMKQTKTAEYDQNSAGQAIAVFNDFMTLHPEDPRVPEARKNIATLKTEQARGSFQVAKYYEKRKRWQGAWVYYNEVLSLDPNCPYAAEARKQLDALGKRLGKNLPAVSAPVEKPAAEKPAAEKTAAPGK
jgi:outer membrane protein assembly factor BamD (BamD/ComL family)